MHHHHGPGPHHHDHGPGPGPGSTSRTFATITVVNLAYTLLEAAYGFLTGSLALLSDALHNLGDVLGLAMAWGAAVIAQWPPTDRHTYGWRRATLLSPLANAVLLVGLSGALAWEALRRLGAPPEVPGMTVIVVAAIGIAVNLGTALMVSGGHGDLNRRGAYLHLMADAAISMATVAAGVGVLLWDWAWLDPAMALLVGIVIAWGATGLLRDSFNAAMDAVPPGIDAREVRTFIAALPGVASVHHLHIWSLGAGGIALTAHLVRSPGDDDDAFIHATQDALRSRFGIDHATLQLERGSVPCAGREHTGGHHDA